MGKIRDENEQQLSLFLLKISSVYSQYIAVIICVN